METQVDVWVSWLDASGPTPYLAALAIGIAMAGTVFSYMAQAMRRATA